MTIDIINICSSLLIFFAHQRFNLYFSSCSHSVERRHFIKGKGCRVSHKFIKLFNIKNAQHTTVINLWDSYFIC